MKRSNLLYILANAITFSTIIAQQQIPQQQSWESEMYNPNADFYDIKVKKMELQIRDVLGNLVKSLKTSASTIEIDLSAQPKGVYFVKIISEQGEVLGVKKVVVQ